MVHDQGMSCIPLLSFDNNKAQGRTMDRVVQVLKLEIQNDIVTVAYSTGGPHYLTFT